MEAEPAEREWFSEAVSAVLRWRKIGVRLALGARRGASMAPTRALEAEG